jgi:hypothetical protein
MRVETAVEYPGLSPLPRGDDGEVDWSVTFDEAPLPAPSGPPSGEIRDGAHVWARYHRQGKGVRIELREILEADLRPRERTATVHPPRSGPSSQTTAERLRRLLPYLVAACGRRARRVALHAAAFSTPAGAVLCGGDARAGKSTLSCALDAAGVPVLADDHVAVEDRGDDGFVAFPSFPVVGASPETRLAFFPEIPPGTAKMRVPLRTSRPREALPVAAVCFLRRGERVAKEPLPRTTALARLLRESVFVGDPGDREEERFRVDVLSRLVERVPAWTLEVPTGLDRLGAAARGVPALFASSDVSAGARR